MAWRITIFVSFFSHSTNIWCRQDDTSLGSGIRRSVKEAPALRVPKASQEKRHHRRGTEWAHGVLARLEGWEGFTGREVSLGFKEAFIRHKRKRWDTGRGTSGYEGKWHSRFLVEECYRSHAFILGSKSKNVLNTKHSNSYAGKIYPELVQVCKSLKYISAGMNIIHRFQQAAWEPTTGTVWNAYGLILLKPASSPQTLEFLNSDIN